MTKGQRIKTLRDSIAMSQVDMAERIGVSKQTLYKYENDIITNIPSDKIEEIARLVGVEPSFIMGWEDSTESIRIPVYGRVAAGIPLEAITDIIDYEEIPTTWKGDYIALKVKGDSMTPRITDGDVIIARKQDDAESGDVVVAMVDGQDATVKKLIKNASGITLQPYNPIYEPMFFPDSSDVKIIGKVVELRGKF